MLNFFFYFVFSNYLSEINIKKINTNRTNLETIIKNQTEDIPVFNNDTDNVIVFNNDFSKINKKPKRKFWDLLTN